MKITVSLAIVLFGLATTVSLAEMWVDEEALKDLESITLLPIVLPPDVEFDNEAKGVKSAQRELARQLALKGYVLDSPRNWEPPEQWTYDAMQEMSPEDIAGLAPASADHFAVGFIESIASSSNIVSSKADVTVSAKIIDRDTGKLVWSNSESRMTSENIVTDGWLVMMLTGDELVAMYKAYIELFKEIPDKEY